MNIRKVKAVLVAGSFAAGALLGGCGTDTSTVQAPKETEVVTTVSSNAVPATQGAESKAAQADAASKECASQATAIYRRFANIADNAESWIGKSGPKDSLATVNLFGDLQDQINLLRQLSEREPDSLGVHELLGEAAFQLAAMIKPFEAHLKQSTHASKRTIDSEEELRELSEKIFKRAASLNSASAYPYDRLARLRLMETGKINDPKLAVYLVQSVARDPSSPMSIRFLVVVMTNVPLLSDSSDCLALSSLFGQLKGEARKELKEMIPFVRNELREAMDLSEQIARNGYVSSETQRSIRELAELEGFLRGILGDNSIGFSSFR